VKQQPNLRREQLLKGLCLIFYTGRKIARNQLLDIVSLGSNEEEPFVVHEPDLHFVRYLLRICCRYQLILTDEFLRKYKNMACREEVMSLVIALLDDRGRSWLNSRDLVFGLAGGLNGWKHFTIIMILLE
jgi:hypothetical protein